MKKRGLPVWFLSGFLPSLVLALQSHRESLRKRIALIRIEVRVYELQRGVEPMKQGLAMIQAWSKSFATFELQAAYRNKQ
jgi:hypothetical protein